MTSTRPRPRRTATTPAGGGLVMFLPTLMLLALGLAGGVAVAGSVDAPPPVVDLVVTTGSGP